MKLFRSVLCNDQPDLKAYTVPIVCSLMRACVCVCVCLCVPVAMEDSQTVASSEVAVTPTVTNTADLTQVLSGLQHSSELNSVLQQQPALAEGMVM